MKPITSTEIGRLDGLTILRFAHAYESGGGVEQHLADLNRELSKRNRLTTIQIQLTYDAEQLGETRQEISKSLLIKIPLLVQQRALTNHTVGQIHECGFLDKLMQFSMDFILRNRSLNDFFVQKFLKLRKVPRRLGEPENVGLKVKEILRRYSVGLVVLHASGGADASEIIEIARSARIPIGIVHHFSNDRLGGISLRQQTSCVKGIAGASLVGVPNYLKKHFWNLSDAVDTEFYQRKHVYTASNTNFGNIIFAPGRITPEKGQADVIEVASILKQRGFEPKVVFAGRVDSSEFASYLNQLVIKNGLSDSVEFLGPLSLEKYRECYCTARVMVMPTRHNEGMPRTLIESQAMKVPPIVYDVGGTREGIINNQTGFLIKLGDIKTMAKAVETLILNHGLYERMSEAGRKFVTEKYSLQSFAERHEKFYSYILDNTTQSLPAGSR